MARKLGFKHTDRTKEKIGLGHRGKKLSLEHKLKVIKTLVPYGKGKDHPNWKGGISSINQIMRHSTEFKLWRKAIFERDNYTCIWCNQRGGELNADHIKPFALYPELRFAIDNGRTLCIKCHKTTDTFAKRFDLK